jgi:hypothetical protein
MILVTSSGLQAGVVDMADSRDLTPHKLQRYAGTHDNACPLRTAYDPTWLRPTACAAQAETRA